MAPGIQDFNLASLRRKKYIPFQSFAGLTKVSTLLLGFDTGSDTVLEINSSKMGYPKLGTAGEGVATVELLPFDFDPSFSLNFQVVYSSAKGSAGSTISFLWTLTYLNLKADASVALIAPATALDTTIASHLWPGTAYGIAQTAEGKIAAGTWTRAQIEAGTFLGLKAVITSVGGGITIGSDFAIPLGLIMSWVPKYTTGRSTVQDNTAS